ncbi:MAG TPA: cytochrome c3 family protein [Spirochaetota bacterium]|nr:cytochrome c3 family protein [Spirochaetota bacterium]HPV39651.1 cytochrome c3 family protein [Spirochaetota bacterium]
MTAPIGHDPERHDAERNPGSEPPARKGRLPLLSGREMVKGATLAVVIILSALYASRDAENPLAAKTPVRGPVGRDNMTIDGNGNGGTVTFHHSAHGARAGAGEKGCVQCHHLALPGGGASTCSGCHRDMDRDSGFFDHDRHISLMADSGSCSACHQGDRSEKNTRPCNACHDGYTKDMKDYRRAPAYRDAMHGICYRCHSRGGSRGEERTNCTFCHREGAMPR